MAIDMNALRAKAMQKKAEKPPEFIPIDLNEGNVQAIFNRCLAKETSLEKTSSIIFYREFGYEKDDIGIEFDKTALHTNRKSIEYLYGQLEMTHEYKSILKMEEFAQSYLGHKWTENKSYIMQLLYLGSTQSERILGYFDAKYNGTSPYVELYPTLSPKDPAFPAWWEAHKGEWED